MDKKKKIGSGLGWKIAKAFGIGALFAFVSSIFLAEELASIGIALGLLVVYLELRK